MPNCRLARMDFILLVGLAALAAVPWPPKVESAEEDQVTVVADSLAETSYAGEAAPDSSGPADRCPPPAVGVHPPISVIEHDKLVQVTSLSPAEVLALDPGAMITAYGSNGQPLELGLRWAGPDEVVYLLDGIPISDPYFGVFNLNWLPFEGVSEIAVLKGSGSSVRGEVLSA